MIDTLSGWDDDLLGGGDKMSWWWCHELGYLRKSCKGEDWSLSCYKRCGTLLSHVLEVEMKEKEGFMK